MLFKKEIKTQKLLPITSELAQQIYELLKIKDANRIFLEDNIATEYTKQVEEEIKKLESEMVSKMNGTFELTAKIPTEYDEEGNVINEEVPATYYTVTTETALKNSMSSELLNISKVVEDIRIWSDGKPDETPSWYMYKKSFE